MNEKTKQILRYVACGLGGLALGIALLGGLSMCATSNKTTADSVNTILTKKNAPITTEGGYTGYTLTLQTNYPNTGGDWNAYVYKVDSNFNLEEYGSYAGTLDNQSWTYITGAINEVYEYGYEFSTSNPNTRFLVAWYSYASPWGDESNPFYLTYLSFVPPRYTTYADGETNLVLDFLAPNWRQDRAVSLVENRDTTFGAHASQFLTNTKTDHYTYAEFNVSTIVFQDVASYYQELGYQNGYDNGSTEGQETGYAEGYADGLQSANFFGSISATQNAVSFDDLSNATANYYTDYGAYFKIGSAIVGETNYYIWLYGYSQVNWSRRYWYLVFAPFDGSSWNMTQSYAQQYQLGFWLAPSNDPYTSNALTIYERKTNYYDDARMTGITNLALFEKLVVADDYKSGSDYYNDGYNQGYENGEAIGDQNGYTRGYQEGFAQTNTKNVFSLFTSAFSSVSSFFSLEVFGFLPLYWFFLAPLFITLITLLLRMVKH